jgi:hypothetical protein
VAIGQTILMGIARHSCEILVLNHKCTQIRELVTLHAFLQLNESVMIEINPIRRNIEDLRERSLALRGFL